MIPEIYDRGDGIRLEFNYEDGHGIFIDMSDETAQDMINIIQNKLNARF